MESGKKENRFPIRFGTDGWRGVMTEEFTPENIERIVRATHEILKRDPLASTGIAIGYDRRKNSPEFAHQVAELLKSLGWKVYLSSTATPTPAVSLQVVEKKLCAGIVITASHNPPDFNGYKIKGSFGGPADVELLSQIEKVLDAPVEPLRTPGKIIEEDFNTPYLKKVASFIDLPLIQKSGFRIAHHAMHGVGAGLLSRALSPMIVDEYACNHDITFRGIAPEPTALNTPDFQKMLADLHAGKKLSLPATSAPWLPAIPTQPIDVALITDGDSDRIALCDGNGDFIDAQIIFSLALEYLVESRGLRGIVCKTNAVSERVDVISEKLGLPCETLPVGFKHVAARMQVADVLMGGEEAGGLGVKAYLPERDGLMMGLLIVERMAREKKSLSLLIQELQKRHGERHYERWDVKLTDPSARARLIEKWDLKNAPSEMVGQKVVRTDSLDGKKFFFKNGGWLLVRISGTEPLVRLYCEMPSLSEVKKMLTFARERSVQ